MKEARDKIKNKKSPLRGLFWIFFVLLIVAGAVAGANMAYAEIYKNKIYPGIYVGNLDLGNKTRTEAESVLKNKIDEILSDGLRLQINGHETTISPTVFFQTDPDMARELITFETDGVLDHAANIGRSNNPLKNIFNIIRAVTTNTTLSISVAINREDLDPVISSQINRYFAPAIDARFNINWQERGNESQSEITIIPEQSGSAYDVEKLFSDFQNNLSQLNNEAIIVNIVPATPQILSTELNNLTDDLAELFESNNEWILAATDKEWPISKEMFSRMIMVEKNNNELNLALGGQGLEEIFNTINNEISRPAQNARFIMENSRVVEFQGSREGVDLDRELTKQNIEDVFINGGLDRTNVVLKTTQPEITTASANDLGIEEVLGIGVSNFRGSPRNRILNIKNGARLLNGILIKPGEEFSLLAALRPFTTENGFLPELVIKGDKIVPEIGGGLCQLGTTTFRATMNSGLPITARSNHSLVVSYYNDPANGNPGTDATIYDPAPDFKFLNDTSSYILFAAEVDMEKYELRFTFWGKNDGRKGYYSAPVVERWIPTGPTREIETTDLAPGARQCQSRHPGADASFTYTIEKPDGTKIDRIFTSHYRPLPQICLVGVAAISPPEESPPADTTPIIE